MTTRSRTTRAGACTTCGLRPAGGLAMQHGKPWLCRQRQGSIAIHGVWLPCWRRRAMRTGGTQSARNGCSVGVPGLSARLLRARLDTASRHRQGERWSMIAKTVDDRPADTAHEKAAKGPLRTGDHPTDSAYRRRCRQGAAARLAEESLPLDARLTCNGRGD